MALRSWAIAGIIWILGSFSSVLHSEDWPQFLGPRRNGASNEKGLVHELPKGGLKPVWQVAAGQGFAGPIVVGDQVFLFHLKGGEEKLDCLAASDGSLQWSVGYPCDYAGGMFREPGPRATPCVAGSTVVSYGADGVLQAVDRTTGKRIWLRKLHEDYKVPEGFFGVSDSPLVDGDRVLINLGAPAGAGLAAFDLATGKTVWTKTNDAASYASPIVADFGGKRTALFFARTGLHGVDPATGDERFFFRWRSRTEASVNAATPLVVDGRIFITASYNTGAAMLQPKESGVEVVWKSQDVLACHYNSCVCHEGHLYGIDGRQEGGARLQCAEAATGKSCWTSEGFGCGALLLVEGRLLIWRENGELAMADASPAGFRPRGEMQVLNGACRSHPALANGRLYVRGPSDLVCIDLKKK